MKFFGVCLISWFLTLGYVPLMNDTVRTDRAGIDTAEFNTVAEIGLRADIWRFSVHTSWASYQSNIAGTLYFAPFRADFRVGADFTVTRNILISFNHECDHAVYSNTYNRYPYGMNATSISITFHGGPVAPW
jgi:hypothetical protein